MDLGTTIITIKACKVRTMASGDLNSPSRGPVALGIVTLGLPQGGELRDVQGAARVGIDDFKQIGAVGGQVLRTQTIALQAYTAWIVTFGVRVNLDQLILGVPAPSRAHLLAGCWHLLYGVKIGPNNWQQENDDPKRCMPSQVSSHSSRRV